ncbi:hypothetical protein PTKIN_Ptkin11bG0135200 [Pterospermum kingtungense]
MGSGNWFRLIICGKISKSSRSTQATVEYLNFRSLESSNEKPNGEGGGDSTEETATIGRSKSSPGLPGLPTEQIAAARIQKAFRAYRAGKAVRQLIDAGRFNAVIQGHTVKQQTSSTLSYLHSWCNIQSQIRARRICMVTDSRLKQKKMKNQLKLEAKLLELEVEWCGGSDTMEEILSRVQQREAAAVKRERAMAYAFSHQWRANASQYLGQTSYGPGKENWGWSWMERWIAARPWEVRVHARQASKSEKEMKVPALVNSALPNGKVAPKVKRDDPTDS